MAGLTMRVEIDPQTARLCMAVVEDFLNTHPDFDMRVRERDDGTLQYSVVMKGEPCCD